MRDTVATIALDHLDSNLTQLHKQSNCVVFPVVKANAYGHGMVEIAQYLDGKVPLICVSSIDEAMQLVEQGIESDILIFSSTDLSDIVESHHEQFIYTVTSLSILESYNQYKDSLRLHIEINTGMNRYGIKPEQLSNLSKTHHQIDGIYTHFNSPLNNEISRSQFEGFHEVLRNLVFDVKWVHVGNASIELIKENPWINAARFGLGLYGYRDDVTGLKPVLSLESKIKHIDYIHKDETLGYDYSFKANEDGYFGSVPIGYGDGFDMSQSQVPFYINGQFMNIIGKICMDQTMVLLDDKVAINDRVEIIGEHRTLQMISEATQISKYVLLTCLSHRIRRIYK